ncbi:MAG: HAMP domain-containing histidine kinase [Muribaculaceae bacterium]|nr:HAMP domain-containing histidine kinase [Muribaculaceae bacterium]
MVLKKKFNLQTKLFLPLVSLLWLVVIVLGILMYRHERVSRHEIITSQLEAFNKLLINTYGDSTRLSDYLGFIDSFFSQSPKEDVLVAMYDGYTGQYLDGVGYRLTPSCVVDTDNDGVLTGADMEAITLDSIGYSLHDVYCYETTFSPDSSLIVRTILPYKVSVSKSVRTDAFLWIVIFTVLIAMTIIAYLTTRHISRNITLLRDFVNRAANDRDFVSFSDFPDDELGDISRQVVNIYNSRSAAVAAREHEHNMALKAIEERAKLKRELTNNISHELKTPVGIVKGYLDTILDEPEMDNDARTHFLTKAQAQINRLCDLLNDLSTMTRLEESSATVVSEPFDFYQLVAGIAEEVDASGIIGSMKFIMVVPYDCEILGNRALISGMLMNLIKNSSFYSRGTEMVLKCIDEDEKFYTFVFYDDGVGVPAESISHLFERFYRVETGRSRKTGGTGLGLPIVKSTVTAMGGNITVENRESGGLMFTFTLPKAKN